MSNVNVNEVSKREAILSEIEGDKEMVKKFIYATNGANLKELVAKVVDECPYVNDAADVYDVVISKNRPRMTKALKQYLEARFGALKSEDMWVRDTALRKTLADKGITHRDAYAPACYILNKAFPNSSRDELVKNVKNANIVIKQGILTGEELERVREMARNSDELRKQLLALLQTFLPNENEPVKKTGSVTSRYNFSFSDVMDIMSKLKVNNTAEAEEKLAEIEAEHAQEITCAADFIKFIS